MTARQSLNLRKPTQLIANYLITTPMFLGGWDQQVSQEHFRNSSFKGALRFWWRALHYGQAYRDAKPPGHVAALAILHKRESELFGCASGDSSQSKVKLQSAFNGKIISANDKKTGPIYFLGQGLYNFKTGLTRNAIAADASVELVVTLDNLTASQIVEVKNSLIALGLLGGLGSRSRRGFGSLAIQSLTTEADEIVFDDLDQIKKFVRDLDYSAPADSPLSTLNQATRIDLINGKCVKELHNLINDEMQSYRTNKKKNDQTADTVFKSDCELMKAVINGEKIDTAPRRIIFGLPHNYFIPSTGKADVDSSSGRRASPVILHLHQLKNTVSAFALHTYLGGQFLPQDIRVEVTSKDPKRASSPVSFKIDPVIIFDFMDRFNTNPDFGHEVLRHG
jgi:CRISPR-associated protein Cmr1